tara:strand:+ start:239 stop:448 length:210 start_codon:yes stop_codon:yes gene_type:complete
MTKKEISNIASYHVLRGMIEDLKSQIEKAEDKLADPNWNLLPEDALRSEIQKTTKFLAKLNAEMNRREG